MPDTLPRPTVHKAAKTFLTQADETMLRLVNRYHLATAEQICRVLYKPSMVTIVRGKLSHLADAGYLLRNEGFQRQFAPGPIVYSVGPKGKTYLAGLKEAVPERLRKGVVTTYGYTHLRHALGVTDVLIAADGAVKGRTDVRIHTMLHEHALHRKGVRVTLPDGTKEPVKPDAWIDFRIKKDQWYQSGIAIEFDRGTEHQPAWRKKVAALLEWTKKPLGPDGMPGPSLYEQAFDTSSLTIAIITTAGEERLKQVIRWTEAELTRAQARAAAPMFWVTTCDPATTKPDGLFFGPVWQSPFNPAPQPLLRVAQGGG